VDSLSTSGVIGLTSLRRVPAEEEYVSRSDALIGSGLQGAESLWCEICSCFTYIRYKRIGYKIDR